ncbi:MAG: type I restriction enzyme HsdR N-terminal domain-containing protein [Balneolaceae bacterium]
MDSPVARHFPPVVFHRGKKYLWNRIRRKPLENLPEERVRLRYIDFLALETEWPHSRIASEAAIYESKKGSPLRADLICYSKDLIPEILIECKAESVSLDEVTAIQAARYNRTLDAKFIGITNGIHEYWFQMKDEKPVELNNVPFQHKPGFSQLRKKIHYWQERGFTGKKSIAPLRDRLARVLPVFWSDEINWETRFLNIREELDGLQFNHYYRLASIHDNRRLAITFLQSPDERSWLATILNENRQNRGMLLINLDQFFDESNKNSRLITNQKQINPDVRTLLPKNFIDLDPSTIHQLPEHLDLIFKKYL